VAWITGKDADRPVKSLLRPAYVAPELTAEQKAEQKQREIEARQKEVERLRLENERRGKAKELLKMVLDAQQRKMLEEKAYFELTSVKSGRRYRIRKGDCRNIEEIDANGNKLATLCFHPKPLPGRKMVHEYDTMTIQKLMLENEEEEARAVANIS
jgi:hypothetical protein